MPTDNAVATTLSQLDAARRQSELYARLGALLAARDAALEASRGLLPADAAAASSSTTNTIHALPLGEALERLPQHAGQTLLAPPPGGSELAAEQEEAFERLQQLHEAIGILELMVAAPDNDGGAAGSSSAAATSTSTAAAADSAAADGGGAAARGGRGGRRAAGGAPPRAVGGLLLRAARGGRGGAAPFLAAPARKRLRALGDDNSNGVPLPCGGRGAAAAARLEAGDVLHVPFSAAEARLLRARLGPPPAAAALAAAAPPADLAAALGAASAALPGRSPLDCWRFLQSDGGADAPPSPATAPTAERAIVVGEVFDEPRARAPRRRRRRRRRCHRGDGRRERCGGAAPAATARRWAGGSRRWRCSTGGAAAAASARAAAAHSSRTSGATSTARLRRRPCRRDPRAT